jgi:hypothetical protein
LWVYVSLINYLYKMIYTGCPRNAYFPAMGDIEEIKRNKKVLYHFAIFAIIIEL